MDILTEFNTSRVLIRKPASPTPFRCEMHEGDWKSPSEFFTTAKDYYDSWKSYAVRELMLKYSEDDAYLHLRCCKDDGRYPHRFWVAADINSALEYGTDMVPWAVY